MPDHFSGIRAEDEPCRIQGIVIEKRVLLLDGDPLCRIRHNGSYPEEIVIPKFFNLQ